MVWNELICEYPSNNSSLSNDGLDGNEDEEDWLWLVGVGAAVLSSVAVALGTILQKLAHMKNAAKPVEQRSKECGGMMLNPLWLLGISMMILLQLPLIFIAYALTAQSLVVPLGAGSTIVFDQLLAPIILKEELSRQELWATLFIIIGVALVSSVNSGEQIEYNTCDLLARYIEIDFVIAACCLLAVMGFSLVVIHCPPDRAFYRIDAVRPVAYCIVAGGSGALMDILLKATGEFTESSLNGTNAWQTIHPYYHLVLVPCFAAAMISYINQGLSQYDAVIFLPLYNCIYILLATNYGAVFYHEFEHFDASQFVRFFSGVGVTVTGIAAMSWISVKKRRDKNDRRSSTNPSCELDNQDPELDLKPERPHSMPTRPALNDFKATSGSFSSSFRLKQGDEKPRIKPLGLFAVSLSDRHLNMPVLTSDFFTQSDNPPSVRSFRMAANDNSI